MKLLYTLLISILFFIGCKNDISKSAPKPNSVEETKPSAIKRVFFTGQVNYDYRYTSDQIHLDTIARYKPQSAKVRFDLSNYQSQYIGLNTITYAYMSSLNRAVKFDMVKNTNECIDYSVANDEVSQSKVYPTDEKVFGHTCEILEFTAKNFTTKYWVSKELRISPNTYKDAKAFNWGFYGNKVKGALILKMEFVFPNYTMYGEVTDIQEKDSNFDALLFSEQQFKKICGL